MSASQSTRVIEEAAAVSRFESEGFLGPLPGLARSEAAALAERLAAVEGRLGEPLTTYPGQLRAKSHLVFPWLADLVRDPRILDAVESLIGPDILVYHLTCWIKDPGDGTYVSWHQDGTYFGLDGPGHVTAWVALTEASVASGCMRFLPGSHRAGQRRHVAGRDPRNLLSNRQQVDAPVNEAAAVDMAVPAGGFSLHHTHVLHASGPNRSSWRRIGIGISYIPPAVGHRGPERLTASLVRGRDRFGHFDQEPAPAGELDAAAVAFHAEACRRFFASHGSVRSPASEQTR